MAYVMACAGTIDRESPTSVDFSSSLVLTMAANFSHAAFCSFYRAGLVDYLCNEDGNAKSIKPAADLPIHSDWTAQAEHHGEGIEDLKATLTRVLVNTCKTDGLALGGYVSGEEAEAA